MKRLIYILPLMLLCACGKPAKSTANAESADSVAVEKSPYAAVIHLKELPLLEDTSCLKHSVDDKIRLLLDMEGCYYDTLITRSSVSCDSIIMDDVHPFINSVRKAYAIHRPVVFSPDAVWFVISRGFAYHVQKSTEQLRPLFVKFDGQKELTVVCEPGLIHQPGKDWEPYFSQFAEQISEWVDSSLVETLTADFSTTTPTSLAASQITIMSAMQGYFKYTMDEGCGIPTIYLEGTAKDWQRIVTKAHNLRKYDLDWWMDELEPVLQEFADAAAGDVDTLFWNSIYKKTDLPAEEDACGVTPVELINGWITKFYPYRFLAERNDFSGIEDDNIHMLPHEIASAPVLYKELGGQSYELNLLAGFLGIVEDSTTHALHPEMVWFVTKESKDW